MQRWVGPSIGNLISSFTFLLYSFPISFLPISFSFMAPSLLPFSSLRLRLFSMAPSLLPSSTSELAQNHLPPHIDAAALGPAPMRRDAASCSSSCIQTWCGGHGATLQSLISFVPNRSHKDMMAVRAMLQRSSWRLCQPWAAVPCP